MRGKSDRAPNGYVKKRKKTGMSQRRRKKMATRMAVFAVLTGVLILSTVKVTGYVLSFLMAQKASNELREIYYLDVDADYPDAQAIAQRQTEPSVDPAQAADAPDKSAGQEILQTEAPASQAGELEAIAYPGNPAGRISSRFEKIRRQNQDIVGWLAIEGLLNEAVVQRDNDYYLRRDYRGYHNLNGAIFLDEACSLQTRPYTLMLYGHNMKTGAMFGFLRNYEDIGFYKNAAFVTFDTMYEEGRYVIFSVATISLDRRDGHYVDVGKLQSNDAAKREEALGALRKLSSFTSDIDVTAEDQFLFLVTCVDNDVERRIVAARRIREGESLEALKRRIDESSKRR